MSSEPKVNMSTEDMIAHYQRSIEKSQSDPKRLLHCVGKLYRMKVTVQHLQATGIGRTVNALRKDDGEVGVAAKSLVAKWKSMVAAEESSECSEDEDDDDADEIMENNNRELVKNESADKTAYSSSSKYGHGSKHRDSAEDNTKSSHRSTTTITNGQNHNREHHSGSRSQHKSGNNHYNSSSDDGQRKDKSTHQKHRESSSSSSSRTHSHQKTVPPTKSIEEDYTQKVHNSIMQMAVEEDEDDDERLVIVDTRSNGDTRSLLKHNSSSSASSERKKSNKNHHSSKSSNGHKSSTSSRHIETGEAGKSEHSSDRKHDRHGSSKNKSSHADKHKSSENSSGSKKRRVNSSEEETSSKRHKSDKASTSSSSSPKKKLAKSSGQVPTEDGFEIDQSMGTSFADALGMIAPSTSKSSKPVKQPTSTATSVSISTLASTSASTSMPSTSKSKPVTKPPRSTSELSSTPALLGPRAKLAPLEDLTVELPTISNNYKPLPINPLIMDCLFPQETKQPPRLMTDEEMFQSIASKNSVKRTKVYSGVKSSSSMEVPSLHELCIRVLQKNIDALEFTGGVPFEILRPVVERASADQLLVLEYYNPYLMDDTDVLWQQHCSRRFRGYKRHEMETWREMYTRVKSEQEKRLSMLTENIKHSQTVAIPVKTTKLAYIDSMVKPPRNVIKKQAQYGTERKLVATPASRVSSLSGVQSNIARTGDTRLRAAASLRDTAQMAVAPNLAALKGPKKAPLMAKTLQFMKGRFKR